MSGRPPAARQLSGSASFSESRSDTIGHISLGVKQTRKPSAGNPHAGFDVAGIGNQFTVRLLRHSQRKRRATARPNLQTRSPSPRPYNLPRSSPPRGSGTLPIRCSKRLPAGRPVKVSFRAPESDPGSHVPEANVLAHLCGKRRWLFPAKPSPPE